MNINFHTKKGSVSVFLMMIIMSFLLIIGVYTESAAGTAARSYADSVFDLAGRSVLSEYDPYLKCDYGIFGMTGDEQSISEKIRWYAEESFNKTNGEIDMLNITVKDISVDLSAHVLTNLDSFEKQIKDYMKYRVIIEGIDVLCLLDRMRQENSFEASDTSEDEIRDNRTLKNKQIIMALPSRQLKNQGGMLSDLLDLPELDGLADIAKDNIYINLYILKLFRHRFDSPEWDNTFFVNEVEYILGGRLSDQSNNNIVTVSLTAFRSGLNLTHIYSDSAKREALAAAAALITPGPAASATLAALAGAWAAAEAAIDMKKLFNGEKVPLIKSADDWVLSLDNLLEDKLEGEESAKKSDKGLTYENYLFLFLCFKNKDTKLIRVMDLIQLNIKGNYNSDFQMSRCYSGFNIICCIERDVKFLGVFGKRRGVFSAAHVY